MRGHGKSYAALSASRKADFERWAQLAREQASEDLAERRSATAARVAALQQELRLEQEVSDPPLR
eukprot:7429211-Alexandrium_andersonii.AAC.1